MRLLPERPDHRRESTARQEPGPHRRADSRRHGQHVVPVHDVLPRAVGDQAGCENHREPAAPKRRNREGRPCRKGRLAMTTFTRVPHEIERWLKTSDQLLSRRGFLKGSGLLVVSVAAATLTGRFAVDADAQAAGPYPDPDFRQLDSWIVIHQNNTATFFVGKTD